MPLWVPPGAADYTWRVSNYDTTRPATTTGTTVTYGNGAFGSYAQIFTGAQVVNDVWAIRLTIGRCNTSGSNSDCGMDLAYDPAGGTNYTTLVDKFNTSCASTIDVGGISYFLPIYIPSGSSIACRGIANGTSPGGRVCAQIYGKPRDPAAVWRGTKATLFGGVYNGTSSGTVITPGTTNEGNWTLLSSNIFKAHHYWILEMGIGDSTMTSGNIYSCDLSYGDASNKIIIVQDQIWTIPSANENLSTSGRVMGCQRMVPAGANLYGRIQCSGVADSNVSLLTHGVF